jgi:hypothetical protein
MSFSVKQFLNTLSHALGEERHFALLEKVPIPTKATLSISFKFGTQSDPRISSVRNCGTT